MNELVDGQGLQHLGACHARRATLGGEAITLERMREREAAPVVA